MNAKLRKFQLILVSGIFCFLLADGRASAAQSNQLYVDVHMHLDGVAQNVGMAEGDKGFRNRPPYQRKSGKMERMPDRKIRSESGMKSSKYYLPAASILVETMDQYDLEKSIIMPPPQLPLQQGGYSFEDLLPAIRKYPDRLVLGAGGGTLNPLIVETDPDKITEQIRKKFKEDAERIVQAGARVFGEMTAMHLCMNPKHHYIAAPPDHPLFLLLSDIAARNNIPIDLHMEAVEKDMPAPKFVLQSCDKNPNVIPATIPAFERLLAHNRDAKIVWQHIGWDNTGQMTPELIERLMSKHSNLYIAVKSVPVGQNPPRPNRIHDEKHNILPEWQKLFQKFSDRVVVGADEFINAGGGYKKPPFFKETWKTISTLPPDLASKIGRYNARKIYGL